MNLVQIWVIRHKASPGYNFSTWKGGRVCGICRLPRLVSYLGASDRRAYNRCSRDHDPVPFTSLHSYGVYVS